MDEIKLTLLAPARDLTVAKAAIQAGADAVYIGAPRFGARAQAGNSLEDIATLVNYAHPFGVQVLVTLNTLLTDDERKEAVAMAWDLYKIGVDALIIQDLRLLDEDLPPIRLHASTQCDNRTPEQILHLQELGFKRVVLARELTIDEIKNISDTLNSTLSTLNSASNTIELEAFIHGACCVSYSGRCYMSEVLMNRSANRGCCAQMCRMAYDLLDKDMNEVLDDEGKPIHQRYLLSLQDMDRSLYLRELIEAGVTTFKIEGRLKDADYVTNIVAYYRQLLDKLINSSTLNYKTTLHSTLYTLNYTFTPNPEKTFHRGSSDYFLHGRTAHMANWDTPKSTGEYVGEIVNNRIVPAPGIELHNGDGLCVGNQGFYYNGNNNIPYSSTPLSQAKGRYSQVYRNHDAAFLKTLKAERRVLVDICFEETASGFRLTIGDKTQEFAYPHEPANNPDRAMNTIKEQLTKLGDTIYQARNVEIKSQPYFIPISTLNQWRRQTINPS
ncbi:MAG: U32 family peptidase [Paludibacteraceae bacterium]|nr:U32 family peptidase [Paludibacteraceae bacterium]